MWDCFHRCFHRSFEGRDPSLDRIGLVVILGKRQWLIKDDLQRCRLDVSRFREKEPGEGRCELSHLIVDGSLLGGHEPSHLIFRSGPFVRSDVLFVIDIVRVACTSWQTVRKIDRGFLAS